MFRLLVLAALTLACAGQPGIGAPESATASPTAVELAPGILVSADRQTAWIMVPGGGIEAIALDTGAALWRSDGGDRPLGIDSGRLVAQVDTPGPGGELRLALLDPATGAATGRLISVPLPPGVRPLIVHTPSEEFRLAARPAGSELLVTWSFLERPVTGVAPPPGEAPEVHRIDGGARIDVASGNVIVLAAGEPDEGWDEAPAAVRSALAPTGGRPPWRAGGLWVGIDQAREADGALRLRLRRWPADGGQELPPIELFRGRAAGALPSADGRHLMVGAAAEAGAPRPWLWRLFAAASGEPVGSLPTERSLAPFVLTPAGVVHLARPEGRRQGERWVEEPLRLRAARLEGGAELWTRPVRDVAHRGPRPPGRPY